MEPSNVVHFTRQRLPDFSDTTFEVRPIERGGSDRKFYRMTAPDGASLIVIRYTEQAKENLRYVELAIFLAECGVRVPRILYHDPEEQLIWMQDLGERDLWSYREEPWENRSPLYRSALREAFWMHSEVTARHAAERLQLELEFSEPLYLWEQSYFFEQCVTKYLGLPTEKAERWSKLPRLAKMAQNLASLPRTLVHRDFQSQNILIFNETAYLIDFQGMRPGLPHYDVASLLYDPYVALAADERSELLTYYKGMSGEPDDFDEVFYQCALQRLMQALGAYGFLGIEQGKTAFLSHIPTAWNSLREVASRIDGLDDFVHLLEDHPPEPGSGEC